MAKEMNSNYIQLRDSIYKAVDDIYSSALLFQRAWMREVARKELQLAASGRKDNLENTAYELRIEFSGSSFVIRWLHIKFTKNNGKVVRLRTAIAIPRNGKYTKANFSKAPEWELSLIEELEDQLAPMRNQLKHLMTIHKALGFTVKSAGQKFVGINIKDRVAMPTESISKYKETL